MKHNHAYQYSCEGTPSTGPLGEDQGHMQAEQKPPTYKYGYPEFEPDAGEESSRKSSLQYYL